MSANLDPRDPVYFVIWTQGGYHPMLGVVRRIIEVKAGTLADLDEVWKPYGGQMSTDVPINLSVYMREPDNPFREAVNDASKSE